MYIRPEDGCLVQPKHVAIYDYYNKELYFDGFYLYCYLLRCTICSHK
jgi:hypothetical protein